MSSKCEMLLCYSLITFDERVSFGFNASAHCLAHLYVALFVCRLMFNQYAIAHAYNAANTHTNEVTGRIEAKKLLSCRRQLDYTVDTFHSTIH